MPRGVWCFVSAVDFFHGFVRAIFLGKTSRKKTTAKSTKKSTSFKGPFFTKSTQGNLGERQSIAQKGVRAIDTPEIRSSKMAQMPQKPVFAPPGCQRMSVNTLLCGTLGLAENFCLDKVSRNCLQWGRSNLVDPAGSPKIHLLNQDFGNILSIFPRKNSKTQSSLNFFSPDPGNLLNQIFRSGPDPASSECLFGLVCVKLNFS